MNGETVSTMPGTLMALIHPNPSPETTEIAANTATATASDDRARSAAHATARGRQDVQGATRNGNATATRKAGCLIDAATPTRIAPSHQRRIFIVTRMPASISPVICASLCAPPMKSMTRMGLRTANQLAAAGSTPTRLAIRGTVTPIRMTPISAGTRIRTADR